MRDTLPLLQHTDFPALRRFPIDTVQANLGYRCNQSCTHCHVAAGPHRKEEMRWDTMAAILTFARRHRVTTLDLTGGAPELNPHFRRLVREARAQGLTVIDRCNLTILHEPDQASLAEFLADLQVEVTASLPCYTGDNVDRQRGDGVFEASLRALRRLNALGYGVAGSGLRLNLVYNPVGPTLPPGQATLEARYKDELATRHGIVFDHLFVLANMPIRRFGSQLVSKHEFDPYMRLLKAAHRPENLEAVMCRRLISVDWQGEVFDCDFNQMLGLPLGAGGSARTLLSDWLERELDGHPIRVADHCYGCTAGQGSSCAGALARAAAADIGAVPALSD